MSLDPAEGKSSPGGEGLCGWGRKGGGGGGGGNPSRDQNTPQQATLAGVVLHFGSLILCCIIWIKGSEEKHRHKRFRKLPNRLEALFVKNYGTASNGRHVRGRRRSEDWTGSAELDSRHGGDAGAARFYITKTSWSWEGAKIWLSFHLNREMEDIWLSCWRCHQVHSLQEVSAVDISSDRVDFCKELRKCVKKIKSSLILLNHSTLCLLLDGHRNWVWIRFLFLFLTVSLVS